MPSADREERFNRLVREHGDAVHRYLRRRYGGGDATDVEDLLADVMAIAWRRLDDVPATPRRPGSTEWPGVGCPTPGRGGTAVTGSSRRFARRGPAPAAEDVALADLSLREALASLPDKEREALTLTAWEGLGPEELALALGVSVNAAAIRLSKAKTKLLDLLSEKADESSPPVATGTQP